ncbi:MAG: carboxy-S-adenosyl-L-methionine synthase CmoA [Gammaproteobacteria bacterium]|nr:carboxy-S-adenosyl-L-methionine synthase CmoA [Gammaproteobacteria bacterium]
MPQTNNPDKIYRQYQQNTQEFQFDKTVADVFSDMIKRSVPGYENIVEMIGVLTQAHAQQDSHCYDLGCSLGASTLAIIHNLGDKNCQVIGVDNSAAMVEKCLNNLNKIKTNINYQIECQDVLEIDFKPASVIVLNFTLQFIPLEYRDDLLRKIYNALLPGGILILSEKIQFSDTYKNELFTDIHHAFKKTQGYSDLEISQKRNALENVLIPETKETHLNRLQNAGFEHSDLWFQCLNFASFFAIKNTTKNTIKSTINN